jgi:ABC-type transporter Mla MlaB component
MVTMSNPQLRKTVLRLAGGVSRRSVAPVLSSVAPQTQQRHFSVELKKWKELGYVDDKGLTLFDTLHEMQVRACQTYGSNEIFGTYVEKETPEFEWMTFSEWKESLAFFETTFQTDTRGGVVVASRECRAVSLV